ncbi:MAG: DNA polymerase I [Holosporaceae bacterium]|jgi:DNA polymerase-1|nr:DNA polymerase I [Holosporaceae bacterium]
MNKLAVLVDGSGFIYRAYYALPQLTNEHEQSIGAVYGFCSMLISLLKKHESDLFCVVLDSGRNTFRSEIYAAYKSNRNETPEDLKSQMPMLNDVCSAFGIPTISKKGFEADDIIATYSEKLSERGYDVRIISSDKDLMQLVTDNISLFDPIKSKVIKTEEVLEKYGVLPSQMVFLQALMGDASDNIPGIRGIGPKTAANLINEFKTLDAIYQNIDAIKSQKIRELLVSQKELLDTSLRLVTLDKNVNVEENFSDLRVSYNRDRVVDFLESAGFSSLVKRLGSPSLQSADKVRNRQIIASSRELKNFFELNRIQKLSFFLSSCADGNNVLAMCCGLKTAYCIFSAPNKSDLFNQNITFEEICAALKPYFENPNIKKIGIRNELRYFKNVDFKSYDDLAVMSYLLRGTVGDKVGDVCGDTNLPICKLSFKNVCEIDQICQISELIYDGYDEILADLERNNLLEIYQKIDRPLINILKNMEENGIAISPQKLNDLAGEFSGKISEIEGKIFGISGCNFNIGSVNQLADVLFSKLNIPKPKRTNSLDVESLEELSVYSPVPALVIEWRRLSKLLSSYTHSLCKLIDPTTNRLHSTFNMTSTITGRLSSSNPNLQNIPHRTEYGKRIREAFVSEKGSKLVSFDYSQIELRILAHMADVRLLKQAFIDNKDIHTITAANMFGVGINEVTEEMRSSAKVINFGIIYGMSPFGLSRALGIPVGKADEYISGYWAQFPEFGKFKADTLQFAKKHGFIQTITGRRCYTKDIQSSSYLLRQFSERQAVNAAIQGSAADVVKIAMIKIFPKLEDFHSKMLIQIHDELVLETKDELVSEFIPVIKDIMEHAVELSVPLEVNVVSDICLR